MYTALDRYKILQDEIRKLEAQLQPTDTGHINTAISVLGKRCIELEEEINARLHPQRH
jgi:hypothetical protein